MILSSWQVTLSITGVKNQFLKQLLIFFMENMALRKSPRSRNIKTMENKGFVCVCVNTWIKLKIIYSIPTLLFYYILSITLSSVYDLLFVCVMCVCMFICVQTSLCEFLYTYMCVEARDLYQVYSSMSPILFKTGSNIN